jgi:5-methylthioadenosine/S-adenosylhomocysteine deaminase
MRIFIDKSDRATTVGANRRLLQSASIPMENDRIALVGPARERPLPLNVDRLIDGSGLLVAPGFVDTHVYNTQQLRRGLAEECDIPKQLLERLHKYESVLTPREAYLSARLRQAELIKAGATCFPGPKQLFPGRDRACGSRDGHPRCHLRR